ncbi:MAG TPA: alpha/beta fold hydrolase [Solirubrobacteraceae bacterium]|nr:alpha/beta fold hydrolase [Solirubrobacteraceae bacterium]
MTFVERAVEADGFEIRYLEAGEGPPLVALHGAGGLRLTRAHELLAAAHRVIAFEVPGFGSSPVNERTQSLHELAHTMVQAVTALDIDRYSVWGQSFGGKLALWLAAEDSDRLDTLVLSSPAALIIDPGPLPPPEQMPSVLFAHPERQPSAAPLQHEIDAKQRALVGRLIGPPRDPELEEAMGALEVPTLVLFGTEDRLTPPELGRIYRELLPQCHFVIVYDAAHAIYADRPEAFAAIVADFLERRAEFVMRRESGLLYP